MFKTKDIISKITILLGLLVIAFSIYDYSQSQDNIQNGVVVQAKIINYEKNDAGENVPIVLYVVNSDTLLLKSPKPLDTYPKENRINIKYDKNNPKNAIIYESYIESGIPISIATIGVMTVLFGLIMLYFTWKKQVIDN